MGLDDERRLDEGNRGADYSSPRSSFENKCDQSKNQEIATTSFM